MPKCVITFVSLAGIPNVQTRGRTSETFYVRVKWGKDGAWNRNPHLTPYSVKDEANQLHTWDQSIIIQSNFDWKKVRITTRNIKSTCFYRNAIYWQVANDQLGCQDAIIFHVYEYGFFSTSHVGDGKIIMHHLIKDQLTPVSLRLTTNLETTIVPGALKVQVRALDFGHELVPIAQAPQQPQQYMISSRPFALANAPSAQSTSSTPAHVPQAAVSLSNGEQLFIQPMNIVPCMLAPGQPSSASSTASNSPGTYMVNSMTPVTAMPMGNGGFMFYSIPALAANQPSAQAIPSTSMPNENGMASGNQTIHADADGAGVGVARCVQPQLNSDFTYVPSAPIATISPQSTDYIAHSSQVQHLPLDPLEPSYDPLSGNSDPKQEAQIIL